MSPEPAQPVGRDGGGGAAPAPSQEEEGAAVNGAGIGGVPVPPKTGRLQDESTLIDGERPLGMSFNTYPSFLWLQPWRHSCRAEVEAVLGHLLPMQSRQANVTNCWRLNCSAVFLQA